MTNHLAPAGVLPSLVGSREQPVPASPATEPQAGNCRQQEPSLSRAELMVRRAAFMDAIRAVCQFCEGRAPGWNGIAIVRDPHWGPFDVRAIPVAERKGAHCWWHNPKDEERPRYVGKHCAAGAIWELVYTLDRELAGELPL